MFKKVLKKIFYSKAQKEQEQKQGEHFPEPLWRKQAKQMPLKKNLQANLDTIHQILGDSQDIIIRKMAVRSTNIALVYLEGMVDYAVINDFILKPIVLESRQAKPDKDFPPKELYHRLLYNVTPAGEVVEAGDFDQLIFLVLTGIGAVLVDGIDKAIMVSAKGWPKRAVNEPDIESVIRGPREGFTETLRVNTVLIRRRIRDPNLRIITTQIGRRSKTDVAIAYIKGIANPELVDEVKKRLETIDIDAVLESAYIEQMIEDNWWSPFPTVQETERPDKVVASLVEGRVAIIVDNTPFVLLVPANINMFMVSPEDAYVKWSAGTFVRLLRFGANFIAMLLPGIYIALTSFHPEMLPTGLALSIAATREAVPFPAYMEAFLMELSLELLREAGIRLPGPISQTIGIVGALVVGTAAVQASLVSPVMVIVVAFTAIAAFSTPTVSFGFAIRQMRFLYMILATFLGLYGIMLGLLFLLGHFACLKSFGMGYLEPFAPLSTGDLKDVMLRLPLPSMHTRPATLRTVDERRMKDRRQDDLQREVDSDRYERK